MTHTVSNALNGALSAAFARPGFNPNTVVLWGDSHCENAGGFGAQGTSGTTALWRARGFWPWASIRLGQRMYCPNNAGVGGQRSDQILARWDSDVAPYAPGWVIVTAGVNDVNQLVTATSSTIASTVAAVKANITSIIGKILSIGARPVICTLPPFNAWIANQNAARDQINRWIKALATTGAGRVVVVDWNPLITAYSASQPQWNSGMSYDGTHGNAIGCARMGWAVWNTLDALVPKYDPLPGYQDTLNLAPNAFSTATAGAAGTGVTGAVATGWTAAPDGASTTTAASKVARTDGLLGEWQQVQATAGNGVRYYDAASGWSVGDQVVAIAEFQADADVSWTTTAVDLYTDVSVISGAAGGAFSMKNAGPDVLNDAYCKLTSGVLITPPMVIPAGTTSLRLTDHFITATGTVRWGRHDLVKIG
jgi:lysophospholipase L1-like esterase